MSPQRIDLPAIAPQLWKNGAGLTREIAFGDASRADFDWRISLAEVERDAAFSAFPGIDRCIALWRGAGMRLRSPDGAIEHVLAEPLAPWHFPGDLALDATLLDGPSSDFNVMTRRGVFRSELRRHRSAAALRGGDVTLLLCRSGSWSVAAEAPPLMLGPMQALLWCEPVDALHVEPIAGAAALLFVRLCHDRRP